MWIQNVTLFENAKVASALWKTAWYSQVFVLQKAAVPFYVQMFFCYRLWAGVFGYIMLSAFGSSSSAAQAISRNVYIVIICIMVFSFALVCGVLAV